MFQENSLWRNSPFLVYMYICIKHCHLNYMPLLKNKDKQTLGLVHVLSSIDWVDQWIGSECPYRNRSMQHDVDVGGEITR